MSPASLRKNIHQAIDKIEDAGLLQAVYTILEKQIELSPEYELTEAQKKEIDQRIANHKSGKSKTYSWDEVKRSLQKRKK